MDMGQKFVDTKLALTVDRGTLPCTLACSWACPWLSATGQGRGVHSCMIQRKVLGVGCHAAFLGLLAHEKFHAIQREKVSKSLAHL
jgi:hypothetical protein